MEAVLTLGQFPKPLAKMVRVAADVARMHRCALFLVGGFVRDHFLGRESWDLDFAISADPLRFSQEVAEKIGGRFVPLHFEPPTGRIVRWDEEAPDATADFTELRGDWKEDARHRDFTCNALYVDALKLVERQRAPVQDPLGGLKHLRQRLLVLPHRRVLCDDPVRILRAFRFATTLQFQITSDTLSAISSSVLLLLNVPAERILMEWAWILQAEAASEALLAMDASGVLSAVLPELEKLKEVPAAGYHHLDGFHHTIEAVRMVERAINAETEDEALNALLKKVRDVFWAQFGYKRYGVWVLKFAALLHDIAKPATMTWDEEGNLHFYGHERVGAEMAAKIAERMKLSRREQELVVALVGAHMRPINLAGGRQLTDRALRRFWRDLSDVGGIYCVALSAADLMATRGKDMTEEHRQRHYYVLRRLMETFFALKEARERIRLITGDEIMERYGIPPSPLVGKALRLIEEAVYDGRVQTKEEAWTLLDAAMAEWRKEEGRKLS